VKLLGETTREDEALRLLVPNREVLSGGRSLGTTRPPAVTRIPGGLPCSLSNLSALPRLMDGDGDGFLLRLVAFKAEGGRVERDGFSAWAPIKQADADGRNTCSNEDAN